MHLEIYTCINKWPVTNNSNDNSWLLFPEPEKVKKNKMIVSVMQCIHVSGEETSAWMCFGESRT